MEKNRTEENNKKFLTKLHAAYLKRVNFYHVPKTELTRFSWSEDKCVIIYVIKAFSDYPGYDHSTMYFAIKSDENKSTIQFIDLVQETAIPDFSRINEADVLKRISWLISKGMIDEKIGETIISSSTRFDFADFDTRENDDSFYEAWTKEWVDKEYDQTQKVESRPTQVQEFPDLPNIKQRFFIDRYHFKDMLEAINDSQFTDEFNQCLWAYRWERWFLCATGLGSCLEHLMMIILTNYDDNGYKDNDGKGIFKGFPKNPTAQDYVRYFKKDPINLTSRQATFVNLLFMARNSVDHHNTGKTQKNLCDLLLDGISDIYNDYYSSSILYKSDR